MNSVPLPRGGALRRIAKRAVVAVRYRGGAVECPLCGGSFSSFREYNGRPDAQCPACGALERHRLLWAYLDRELLPEVGQVAVLHVAPEPVLMQRLASRAASYTAFDLESPLASVHGDLTDAPFEDGSFDLIVCSHVLEHIVDDHAAMRELGRLLRPHGRAVVLVPVDASRPTTYEDASIVAPADRLEAFGQADHVRIYGRDVVDRLTRAGLAVDAIDYRDTLGGEAERLGATASETLYVCSTDR